MISRMLQDTPPTNSKVYGSEPPENNRATGFRKKQSPNAGPPETNIESTLRFVEAERTRAREIKDDGGDHENDGLGQLETPRG